MHIRLIVAIDCYVSERREKIQKGEKEKKGKKKKSCLIFHYHPESIDLLFLFLNTVHRKLVKKRYILLLNFKTKNQHSRIYYSSKRKNSLQVTYIILFLLFILLKKQGGNEYGIRIVDEGYLYLSFVDISL
jgi:hypothetical protein